MVLMWTLCVLCSSQRAGSHARGHAESPAGVAGSGRPDREGGERRSEAGGHDQLQTGHRQEDRRRAGGALPPRLLSQ